MEFYDVINKRKTIREFENKDVEFDKIERMIEAGIKAPTNNHLRQWEFIVLSGDEKEEALKYVKEFVSNLKDIKDTIGETNNAKAMYNYAIPRQYSMLLNAPYVIIPLFKAPSAFKNPKAINHLNAFASIWTVIENILLAATNENLACSLRIPVNDEYKKVCKLLNVPEDYIMPCYLGVGYPKEYQENIIQTKVSIKDKIHKGKW